MTGDKQSRKRFLFLCGVCLVIKFRKIGFGVTAGV